MKRIELDGSAWLTANDFYSALLVEIGAPDWHGRSIAALIDSMIIGDINAVEAPYSVVVRNWSEAEESAQIALVDGFTALARYGAKASFTRTEATVEIASGSQTSLG